MKDKYINLYKKHSQPNRAQLSLGSKERVKEKIFQRISGAEELKANISFWESLKTFSLMPYAVVIVVLVLTAGGTAYASTNALPGDWLYHVKRVTEQSRILFAPNQQSKIDLEVKFAEERLRELDTIELGLTEPLEAPKKEESKKQVEIKVSQPEKEDIQQRAEREVVKVLNNLQETQKTLKDKKIDEKTNAQLNEVIGRLKDHQNRREIRNRIHEEKRKSENQDTPTSREGKKEKPHKLPVKLNIDLK